MASGGLKYLRRLSILLLIVLVIFLAYLLIEAEGYTLRIIYVIYVLICISLIVYLFKFLSLKNAIGPIADVDMNSKTVAIAVTYRDQNHDIIQRTCELASKVKGITKFYLVDNSIHEENKEYAKDLCYKLGFEYVTAPQNQKISWKAEPLNLFLFNYLKEDYVILIDKDEKITDTNLVTDNLPYMRKDVAYVQTMKMDKGDTLLNKTLADYNNFFYQVIQPVDGSHGNALFGGSMALMDVKKLKEVNGFKTILEDVDISLRLLDKGYKGLFNPKNYSEAGESDLNYDYFTKRHYRYAYGTTDLFIGYIKRINKIPLDMHAKYLYNLLSPQFLSIFLFLISLYVLAITTYNLSYFGQIGLTAGAMILLLPMLIMTILSIFTKGNPLTGILAFMINQSIAFIRFRATLAALSRIKVSWNVKCKKFIESAWLIFGTIILIILAAAHPYWPLWAIYGIFWLLYVAPVIIYLKEN